MKGPTKPWWPQDGHKTRVLGVRISVTTHFRGPAGLKTTHCSLSAPSNFLTGHQMNRSCCEEQTL